MDINKFSPKGKITNKHLLSLKDYQTEEMFEILYRAKTLKVKMQAGEKNDALKNTTTAIIFGKTSTRTRISFELGIRQLGGDYIFMPLRETQLGNGETIHDTVKVICRYGIDCIVVRTFEQKDIEEMAKYSDKPIVNGLTDYAHPCQVLADLLTIWEKKGRLSGLKIAYEGDGNNIANSLLAGCSKAGMEIAIACPDGYRPHPEAVSHAMQYGDVLITDEPEEAVANADIVYTDVFFSLGQELNKAKYDALKTFQVNERLMSRAKKDAIFMHCLPAHRGEEVTEGVIDGPASVVFDQAENRLHAQKAVLSLLINRKPF